METSKAWPDHRTSYDLTAARIVAIVVDGGAVVETLDLRYSEGRIATAYADLGQYEKKPPVLETLYEFTQVPEIEPLLSEAVEATIVIDGAFGDDRLEIRGKGWIGYDDHGQLSGWFDEPPQMLLDTLPESGSVGDGDQSTEDWERQMGQHPPLPTPQFERACRGRPDMPKRPDDE